MRHGARRVIAKRKMDKSFLVDVTIDTAVENDVPGDIAGAIEKVARITWCKIDMGKGSAELSLFLTNDAQVRRLNKDYRNKDKPTNVLSFSASDDTAGLLDDVPNLLGDVVLGFETIRDEAARHGKTFADHVCHLSVHGVLHLAGFDHETDASANEMQELEIDVLAAAGIADPYGTWVDASE